MPQPSWIHRQPTLLPGRPLAADHFYFLSALYSSALQAAAFAVYGLYAVREAGLTPLQLVLVGTMLEGAVFVFEIPTGVVADLFSRRLSILVGYATFGASLIVFGLFPSFVGVLAAQGLLGFGWTFLSGAREAWLADELGEERAAELYPRVAQWRQLATLAGTVGGIALSFLDLRASFLAAGTLQAGLVLGVLCLMTEAGYTPVAASERASWGHFLHTASAGIRAVRGRAVLLAAFVIALLAGMASESFDRLWPYHLLENVGVPGGIDDVVLFGTISIAGQLGAVVWLRLARRVTPSASAAAAARTLAVSFAAILAGLVALTVADHYVVAIAAVTVVGWARAVEAPYFVTWVNRGLDPRTRATVLSTLGQADALGQVGGGPVFGGMAAAGSVRLALGAAAAIIAPAVLLIGRQAARKDAAAMTFVPSVSRRPGRRRR